MQRFARKPKLLYLVTEDWYFVSHRLGLAKAAHDAGYDVTVATRIDKQSEMIRSAGLHVIPLDFSRSGLGPLKEAGTVSRLISLYRREQPDIVHHVAMKPVIYGSLAARAEKVKGVVNAMMGLGYVFSSDARKAQLLRPVVRTALRSALSGPRTRVIVQNEDDRELFASEGLARPADIRLVRGSGVDPTGYIVSDVPAGPPVVVLPARILRDKGIVEFVEAARALKERGHTARFVLVGDPDDLNPASITQGEIAAWVREGAIEHWGWRPQSEMPAILAQSSIVCLPSYREGLPKALLEAAAAARAIVTTDVPGCREIVRPGVNGWLVPPRNSAELAAALDEALRDPARCQAYGRAGRAMVEREFSLDRVIAETLAVYRELLDF